MRIIIIFFFALMTMCCTAHVDQISPCVVLADTVHYFTDVYPILDRTCALPTCHIAGSEHGNFKSASEVISAAKSGRLEFMIVTKQMPAGTTRGKSILTDCEITIIRAWIHRGAPLN
jgi:hypothetical protein